jgi:hypothetical protein
VQASYQYSGGVELQLPYRFTASALGFLHDYTGLADYYDGCSQNGQATCTFDGRAVGLEVLVRRRLTERFTGWLSYTLSRTERDWPAGAEFGNVRTQVVRGLSEFDRTHVLNAVFAADLGDGWRAGLRVMAYSGLPYASHSFGSDTPPDSRGPPFVRVDVRFQKTWRALGGKMSFVFEWLNALLQKESISTTCSVNYPSLTPTCAPQQLPIPITFPSVGLEQTWGE